MRFFLIKPTGDLLVNSVLEVSNDDDASYKAMHHAVDGSFEICTQYFDGLPEYVDAWCNEECLLRADLVPSLIYLVKDGDTNHVGMLKGNILFTAYNDDGETLGLTDEQIAGILATLTRMPLITVQMEREIYPTYFRM